MTANERTRPNCGDRFGRLRVLRAAADGARTVVFCQCQRSFVVATEDLIAGAVTSCPRCRGAEANGGQAPPRDLIADGAGE